MKSEPSCILVRRWIIVLAIALTSAAPANHAQSIQDPSQSANSSSQSDLPDAPSPVQAPPAKFPVSITPYKNEERSSSSYNIPAEPQDQEKPTPPLMPPIETLPPGTPVPEETQTRGPRNQIDPQENLYKISVTTNFVQIPVMIKDSQGRLVYGLLPRDFTVKENGVPQKLTFFTSDPFQLSVAIVLDLGMADVAVQEVNQTYDALVSAFSPYDEFALYTYSSAVSQISDFTGNALKLTAALDSMKSVRGRNNGPPVLGGPLGPQPPVVSGLLAASTAQPPPFIPAPIEAHVLNDAILSAALDLSKRDRTRRKVILIISDGNERGSQAKYGQVLKVLETYGIQVMGVVVDQGALPVFKQIEKIHHVLWQGYSNIVPKYTIATGGGNVFSELSRKSIENAYSAITSQARNQYTLGYIPGVSMGGSPYRSIDVIVDMKNVKVYTKNGYYPVPSAH
jgi:VWFA-related protein